MGTAGGQILFSIHFCRVAPAIAMDWNAAKESLRLWLRMARDDQLRRWRLSPIEVSRSSDWQSGIVPARGPLTWDECDAGRRTTLAPVGIPVTITKITDATEDGRFLM